MAGYNLKGRLCLNMPFKGEYQWSKFENDCTLDPIKNNVAYYKDFQKSDLKKVCLFFVGLT